MPDFELLHDYHRNYAYIHGLTTSWSIYDIDDLGDTHPYHGVKTLSYREHWGPQQVDIEIVGDTWADLWKAADACIIGSTDTHHIFIERFYMDERDPTILYLSTGS